jgi:hypothetical protein
MHAVSRHGMRANKEPSTTLSIEALWLLKPDSFNYPASEALRDKKIRYIYANVR